MAAGTAVRALNVAAGSFQRIGIDADAATGQ